MLEGDRLLTAMAYNIMKMHRSKSNLTGSLIYWLIDRPRDLQTDWLITLKAILDLHFASVSKWVLKRIRSYENIFHLLVYFYAIQTHLLWRVLHRARFRTEDLEMIYLRWIERSSNPVMHKNSRSVNQSTCMYPWWTPICPLPPPKKKFFSGELRHVHARRVSMCTWRLHDKQLWYKLQPEISVHVASSLLQISFSRNYDLCINVWF